MNKELLTTDNTPQDEEDIDLVSFQKSDIFDKMSNKQLKQFMHRELLKTICRNLSARASNEAGDIACLGADSATLSLAYKILEDNKPSKSKKSNGGLDGDSF